MLYSICIQQHMACLCKQYYVTVYTHIHNRWCVHRCTCIMYILLYKHI